MDVFNALNLLKSVLAIPYGMTAKRWTTEKGGERREKVIPNGQKTRLVTPGKGESPEEPESIFNARRCTGSSFLATARDGVGSPFVEAGGQAWQGKTNLLCPALGCPWGGLWETLGLYKRLEILV